MIDSDKIDSSDKINETKTRVLSEFKSQTGSVGWLTEGREIENYVDHLVLQDAVKTVYTTSYDRPAIGDLYDHALYFYNKNNKLVDNVDKVKVARMVCREPANLSVLDLGDRINEIVDMIKQANK